MALHRCPECRQKISDSAISCPHCGFSFKEADLDRYRQKLEERWRHNQEINKQSTKLHLVWLVVFILVIGIASVIVNG
ncbi:zinc ribbon domain-containing protein [Pasteurella sp. PK-2025]|uniref:zinc ribbon domain-containing protein n=1 Tax=Pasteurella sp. PK-2025 TaxID=3413133 RepID=UPI003C71942C